MLSKLDVGHEVGSEALRNAGTLQLALRVAGSARDDELVVAALECTHEDLQDVHSRVVNVEQVGAVEDHDLSGISSNIYCQKTSERCRSLRKRCCCSFNFR